MWHLIDAETRRRRDNELSAFESTVRFDSKFEAERKISHLIRGH
jgi:hypothetical protein